MIGVKIITIFCVRCFSTNLNPFIDILLFMSTECRICLRNVFLCASVLNCFPHKFLCSSDPHGLLLTGLQCLWDSPGRNSGVRCHAFLQGIFPTRDRTFFYYVSWVTDGFLTAEPSGKHISSAIFFLIVPRFSKIISILIISKRIILIIRCWKINCFLSPEL